MNKVEALESANCEQKHQLEKLEKDKCDMSKQIIMLEDRIDAQEQYSRMDNVVISGLQAHSYASAADTSIHRDQPTESEHSNVQSAVLEPLSHDMRCNVKPCDISAVHYLRKKNNKKDIIVKFVSRQVKDGIMKSRKLLRGREPNIYINEHLTEKTSKLAYEARQLKKQGRVTDTWTRNCKVLQL